MLKLSTTESDEMKLNSFQISLGWEWDGRSSMLSEPGEILLYASLVYLLRAGRLRAFDVVSSQPGCETRRALVEHLAKCLPVFSLTF